MPGLETGVYHYVSRDHCFERRCTLCEEAANRLAGALPPGALLVGLSSIHWREAWKYGERAFRYCQHDAGHAIATFRYAAAALGWSAVLLDSVSDSTIATLLGLDRAEDFADVDKADREHPDAILLVSTQPPCPVSPPSMPNEVLCRSTWAGRANVLSSAHVEWCIIDDVARATWKPDTELPALRSPALLPPLRPTGNVPAATLIRQRRSCLALDGKTSLTAETFYGMLDHLLPRPGVPPWDVLPWPPHVHAGISVHRIRELPPGLYLFERNACVHDRLSAAIRSQFRWKRAPGCPEHLRLFCLAEVDLREAARVTSCHQEIASDGAFSLGMIADFGESIRRNGAWWYRRLFWEAGTLGHVLYLEAEVASVRSTGIGCYFDDVFHELLGLTGDQFQSLYHFTVGGPTEDRRLTTIEPYAHLSQRKNCTREP
jgi:nitroreductase